MPNGGSDCCGSCWFNRTNQGECDWLAHADKSVPPYCEIRNLAIEDPFYTYCANHPHRRPDRDPIPIGPVMRHDHEQDRRIVWKRSPDSEKIRQHLLNLLHTLPEHLDKDFYPIGTGLGSAIIRQLGEFRERRAVGDLEWARDNSEGSLYEAANEALTKIRGLHDKHSWKHPDASEAEACVFYKTHFDLLAHRFDAYSPETPSKRQKKSNIQTSTLAYPDFSADLTNRVHFLAYGSLRRERSSALAKYANAIQLQTAPNGDVLLSVGVSSSRVQFFERLIESTGSEGLGIPLKKGTFEGWAGPDGKLVEGRDFEDPTSPWKRINDDNFHASLYHWSLLRGQLSPKIKLPQDVPPIPESLPWDPDPRFQAILQSTQEDRLLDAVELLEAIPGVEREVLFDEVIYLRFLTSTVLRGEDIRYLGRKYVVRSQIRPRLEEEFEDFILKLDRELAERGSLTNDFPGFGDRSLIYKNDPSEFVQNTPPISNWPATRQHYYKALELYGHPIAPRGRIFIWHPNLASQSLSQLHRTFAPQMVAAENAFRRAKGIPVTA